MTLPIRVDISRAAQNWVSLSGILWAYPLPLRGNTGGDGRSRGKYSRMADGEPSTYWKSNPYLTSKFTGEVILSIRSG